MPDSLESPSELQSPAEFPGSPNGRHPGCTRSAVMLDALQGATFHSGRTSRAATALSRVNSQHPTTTIRSRQQRHLVRHQRHRKHWVFFEAFRTGDFQCTDGCVEAGSSHFVAEQSRNSSNLTVRLCRTFASCARSSMHQLFRHYSSLYLSPSP